MNSVFTNVGTSSVFLPYPDLVFQTSSLRLELTGTNLILNLGKVMSGLPNESILKIYNFLNKKAGVDRFITSNNYLNLVINFDLLGLILVIEHIQSSVFIQLLLNAEEEKNFMDFFRQAVGKVFYNIPVTSNGKMINHAVGGGPLTKEMIESGHRQPE